MPSGKKTPKLFNSTQALHHFSPGILSKAFSSFCPIHPWFPSNLESQEEPVDFLCVHAYYALLSSCNDHFLPFILGSALHLDDSAQT